MVRRAIIAAALIASLVVAAPAAAQPVDTATATQVGFDAYEYGLPLTEVLRVRATESSVKAPDGKGNQPINVLGNAPRFPDEDDDTVVAPNVDTLYTIAHLDLGRHPMVLSTPNMGKRFWVFEFVDPWTNVIGYVGTRTTGQKARKTALVWGKQKAPKGTHVIRSKYRRVWVIGRTLVNGSKDIATARKVQRQYRLTPKPRYKGPPGKPIEAKTPEGIGFYDALAKDMADNPPPARDAKILAELKTVGIEPGKGPTANRVSPDVRAGLEAGYEQAKAVIAQRGKLVAIQGAQANGGWYFPPKNIGDYGTDYKVRADIAVAGLGANTDDEAVYPVALTDGSGALLTSDRKYTITFAADNLPPQRGFWSLTMYDLSGYLAHNDEGIHAVGPTHDGFVTEPDGSVVIAIQKDKPADATVNWLPPPASGAFRLNLRLYWPKPSVLNGEWKPPPVVPTGG